MLMLIMVLDDPSCLDDVLDAWVEAGVQGITILESTGLQRVLTRRQPEAAYMGFGRLVGVGAEGHKTLFAVIEGLEIAKAAVAATEEVLGSLDEPNTGLVFALPIAHVWGLPQPCGPESASRT